MTLIAIVQRCHCCVKLPMNNFSSGLPNNFLYYEILRPSIYYFLHVLWSKYVIPLAIGHSYYRGLVGNHKSMATVFIVFFWKPWGHSINNWKEGVPLPATYDFWEDTTYSVMSPSLERTHSLILNSYWSPQAFHLGMGPCRISPIYSTVLTGIAIILRLFWQLYCWKIMGEFSPELLLPSTWPKRRYRYRDEPSE